MENKENKDSESQNFQYLRPRKHKGSRRAGAII